MMLDAALRGTLRNFSTLFLVLFLVLGPLHFLYAFLFQDVLALRELHPAIAEFPPSRQVRGVGRSALDQARLWLWGVMVIELTLLPVFARVASHVRAMDERDEVPTAIGAWRRVRAGAPSQTVAGGRITTVLAGVALGLAIGFLTEATLMVLADLVPDDAAFGIVALARSVGRSAGGAIAIGTFIYGGGAEPEAASEKVPGLY